MKKSQIDSTDIRILSMLRNDGRMTNKSMAKEIGLSEPSTLTRVKKLLSRGFVRSVTTSLNLELLGYPNKGVTMIHFLQKDESEVLSRIKASRLVITAMVLKSGEQLKANWVLLMLVGKSQEQITKELRTLLEGLDIFVFESFKDITELKCNDFQLAPEDIVK